MVSAELSQGVRHARRSCKTSRRHLRTNSCKTTPGHAVPVRIDLVDRLEGGLTLAMNDMGIVYLGALATAILESLKAELEGLFVVVGNR
jgi:hypothetical protein